MNRALDQVEQTHVKLYPIGSQEFRTLDWKSQIEIVKIKAFEPERYDKDVLQITRINEATQKLIDDLAFLVKEQARSLPSLDGFPITIKPHWIASRSWLNIQRFHINCLGAAQVPHRYFINTILFKFPFLIIPTKDINLTRFMDYNFYRRSLNHRYGLDFFKFKIYLDVDLKTKRSFKSWDSLHEAIDASKQRYRKFRKLSQLNGYYPVVSPEGGYAHSFAQGELVAHWDHRLVGSELTYVPLIPRKLLVNQWSMQTWSFLV